jgi:subtilisin
MQFTIPTIIRYPEVQTLKHAKAEHLGWQLRAWQIEKVHALGIKGAGVVVGVGDTGISQKHLRDELSGVDQHKSFVGGSSFDRNGHGSHCQGIIQAKDNGNGMLGFAPDAVGKHAKVLSDGGSGGDRGIADGINWMVDQGCHIISLSLGSPQASSTILRAIKEADDRNTIVFAAAGNDGRNNHIDEPANSGHCIPVGAVDSRLRLASFSDRGPSLQKKGGVASGVNVYSTVANGYARMSGTSMATPSMAGLCALAISAEIKYTGKRQTKDMAGFQSLMQDFSVDLGPEGTDPAYGMGAFDVLSYCEWLEEESSEPIEPEPSPEWSKVSSWQDEGNEYQLSKRKSI